MITRRAWLWMLFVASIVALIVGVGLCGHPDPREEFGSGLGAVLIVLGLPLGIFFAAALFVSKERRDGVEKSKGDGERSYPGQE